MEVEVTESPVVECPRPDNPYSNDEGECFASLDFEAVVSDNCGVESTVYSVDNETIDFPHEFPDVYSKHHKLHTNNNVYNSNFSVTSTWTPVLPPGISFGNVITSLSIL